MQTCLDTIRQTVAGVAPAQEGADAVRQLVDEFPLPDALQRLAQATQGASVETLGYMVFPALRQRLRDDDLFGGMLQVAADKHVAPTFRIVALHFLADAAQARDTPEPFLALVRGIAGSAAEPPAVRARAARFFGGDSSDQATRAIGTLLASDQPGLVDAAAHVLTTWLENGVALPQSMITRLLELARSHPEQAIASPGMLTALATLPTAQAALETLLMHATSPDLQVRALATVGERVSTATLARLITTTMDQPSATAHLILQSLVTTDPARLVALEEAGHLRACLYAATLEPSAASILGVNKVVALTRHSDPQVRALATALLSLLPDGPEVAAVRERGIRINGRIHPKEEITRAIRATEPGSTTESGPATPRVIGPGYALYRDLNTIPLHHWHTGVFLGFKPVGTSGCLSLIDASNMTLEDLIFDVIMIRDACRNFAAPDTPVATIMRELRDAFVLSFREHKPSQFHGARKQPKITADKRKAVAATATSFLNKGIDWSALMLCPKWWLRPFRRWNGTVSDIAEIRCDGVVEFSYEKNDLPVCSGFETAKWNITAPDFSHVDNHNWIHRGNYDPGELCPRIQAGDTGDPEHAGASDATTFVKVVPQQPEILDFQVRDRFLVFAPSIQFRVAKEAYDTVYVRLTVSKDGGPRYFVHTEDPYQSDPPTTLIGDWQFFPVRSNTTDTHLAFWMGKTVNGPDYGGEQGNFEFQIEAVDPGGNVSALQAVTVAMHVPGAKERRPCAYVSPGDATVRIDYLGPDDHIHELWLQPGGTWAHTDFSRWMGAPPAAGRPYSYAGPDATARVVYRGQDNHLYELSLPPGSTWSYDDLSEAPLPGADLTAYVTPFDATARVVYSGNSGQTASLHELSLKKDGSWDNKDLGQFITGRPAMVHAPCAFVTPDAVARVVFSDDFGVHVLSRPEAAETWDHILLNSAPLPIGRMSAYVTPFDATARVVYVGSDHHIHELYLPPGARTWTHADLSQNAQTSRRDPVPPADAGGPCGYVTPFDAVARVVYRGTDGHIHELFLRPGGTWLYSDLDRRLNGAASAASDPFCHVTPDGTARVDYCGQDDHIHELWLQPGGHWSYTDLTAEAKRNEPVQPAA
jgi:hypothetical protein